MDVKTNVMSPASTEAPQQKPAVKADKPEKAAKAAAKDGVKEKAKGKDEAEFDAVLEKSKASNEAPEETAPAEQNAALTTPLAAELAAAAQLLDVDTYIQTLRDATPQIREHSP